MGQSGASDVFQALEEKPDGRQSAAEEERRQHILESIAKLEGNSKPAVPPSAPIKHSPIHHNINNTISSQLETQPNPYLLAPSQAFAPAAFAVPYFFYPSFTPNHLTKVHTQFSSHPIYPSIYSGPRILKHSSVPSPSNSPQTRNNQELRGLKNQQNTPPRATQRHFSTTNNSHMKTPEMSYRAHTSTASPQSSSESSIQTPPSRLTHNSARNTQLDAHPPHHRKILRPSVQHELYPDLLQRNTPNDVYGNMSKSGSYAFQLESKKTGAKLIEKKRLTAQELKLLEALPPLPPRPEFRKSPLSCSTNPSVASKQKKKDKFAWLDYCTIF